VRARIALALLVAGVAACATPAARIKRRQAAFDGYPPAVQAAVRAGRAEVGFTPEQVELALGRPDRRYERKTAAGTQEVWAYGGGSARPSVSLGFGMGGGSYGGGLGVGSEAARDDRERIVFENGAVLSVEKRQN